MGAASTPARICPECGTRNSGLSLFCAECGESLTNAAYAEPADTDSQTTATYRPLRDASLDDPNLTQAIPVQPTMSSAPEPAHVSTWELSRPVESRRGLVLGWIAGVLILLVIAWLGWTSFLDPGTRDDIIGLFG